jgi:hypothetical protein
MMILPLTHLPHRPPPGLGLASSTSAIQINLRLIHNRPDQADVLARNGIVSTGLRVVSLATVEPSAKPGLFSVPVSAALRLRKRAGVRVPLSL